MLSKPPRAVYPPLIWLLPAVIIALAAVSSHALSGKPPQIQLSSTSLETVGGNLLKNPSFADGLGGWNEYHNAQPMKITQGRAGAAVHIGNVKNSVQEIYQVLTSPRTGAVVISGRITISGSPLPGDASVVVMCADSANHGIGKFFLRSANGTGSFPFAFAYKPEVDMRKLVLAVVVGKVSNNKTIVSFENLRVARAKT